MTHDEIVIRLKEVAEDAKKYEDYGNSVHFIRWSIEDVIDDMISDKKWEAAQVTPEPGLINMLEL